MSVQPTRKATKKRKPIVFMSYAHADRTFAVKVAEDLTRSGVAVQMDQKSLSVGDSISEFIEHSIEKCDFFCLVLSAVALSRPWVQREYRAALNLQLAREGNRPRILPLVVETCDLPVFLRDVVHADFTESYKAAFEGLAEVVLGRQIDGSEKDHAHGPAPFLHFASVIPQDALVMLLARDPDCRNLPETLCRAVYTEVIRSTNVALAELCHLSKRSVVICDYTSIPPVPTLGKVVVVKFPKISVYEHSDYDNTLDQTNVWCSFSMTVGFLAYRTRKAIELVRSRALYFLPEIVEWGADGGFPDGMGAGSQTIEVVDDGGLFPNRDKWTKIPPEFGVSDDE